jgi:hypothetical protein
MSARSGPVPALAAAAAAGLAALALSGLALTGCGSAAAGPAPAAPPGGIAAVPLATALTGSGGTGWAVLQLGRDGGGFEDFWQLFVRPAGATRWRLATPAGVASNGGLVASATGAATLITGFRPSQDLTFSPLASTTDAGARWSQGSLISPGLASVPDALAAGPGGRLIALTDRGQADLGAPLGTRWTSLTTERALARTAAGRSCSLAGLTAAGWTPAGTPLLGGACGRPGAVGIFAFSGGAWHAAGPVLPPALQHGPVRVTALASSGTRVTAVLTLGGGAAARYLAAWSDDNGGHWVLSAALTGRGPLRSISILAAGSAGLVLSGRRGVTIAGPGAPWRLLPPLPAAAQAIAAGPAGQPQVLAGGGTTLTAWQLGQAPGGGGEQAAGSWVRQQTLHVPIPYGSSG